MLELLEADIIGCRKFVRERFNQNYAEFATDVSSRVKELYESRISDPHNQLIISPFIRNPRDPYIPGSSIKGAIRTGLIYHLLKKEPAEKNKGDLMEALLLESERGFLDRKTDRFISRDLNPQTDPFRAIKLLDAKLPENSVIIEKIDSVTKEDGQISPMGIPLVKEVTKSRFTGNTIRLSTEMRYDDMLLKRNKDIKRKIKIEDLIQGAKEFSRAIIDYELGYFRGHPAGPAYTELENYLSGLEDNEFMIRLGWGCGFNSVTVNLKMRKPKIIKTRKLIDSKIPLGWVKISIEDKTS